jgi:hypothetical protein
MSVVVEFVLSVIIFGIVGSSHHFVSWIVGGSRCLWLGIGVGIGVGSQHICNYWWRGRSSLIVGGVAGAHFFEFWWRFYETKCLLLKTKCTEFTNGL